MGMPPSVTPGRPGVLDHVDVRIAVHLCLREPPVQVKLVAHQIEQAIRKVGRAAQV